MTFGMGEANTEVVVAQETAEVMAGVAMAGAAIDSNLPHSLPVVVQTLTHTAPVQDDFAAHESIRFHDCYG